ncbi:Homeobox domain [Musa troglodytarum]|uniref:Homeobox domain n=1 Tax=Musa troglodytarum TaxID=320322 RepID=A0A9E7KL94_9LILI|nr:Homeobox domain [Musa troglodytarum]
MSWFLRSTVHRPQLDVCIAFVPFIFPFCLRGCYLFRQPEYLYTDVHSSSSSSSATALGDGGAARSTVLTNEVAFEVAAGPLNIKETFGHEAVLLDHSGHPVLTDEWGVTIHPLQHGAYYYLKNWDYCERSCVQYTTKMMD